MISLIHDRSSFRSYVLSLPDFMPNMEGSEMTPVERSIAIERRLDNLWRQYAHQFPVDLQGRIIPGGNVRESAEHNEMQKLSGTDEQVRLTELMAAAPTGYNHLSPLTRKRTLGTWISNGVNILEHIPHPADVPVSAARAWSKYTTSAEDVTTANEICRTLGKMQDGDATRRDGADATSGRAKLNRFMFISLLREAVDQLPDEGFTVRLEETNYNLAEEGFDTVSRSAAYSCLKQFPELFPAS